MEILCLKKVSFKYATGKDFALNDIDLSVKESEFLLLLGPTGCGKSTLLKLLKPSVTPVGELLGDISMFGKGACDITGEQDCSRIGYVGQDTEANLITESVWSELAFGLESCGMKRELMHVRIAEMACFFGIQDLFEKPLSVLSGGQKQIVGLASVMVTSPDILILDEPCAQLDPLSSRELINVLKRINDELGTTVIITDHRVEELFPLADRIVMMKKGRIDYAKSPRAVAKEYDKNIYLPAATRIFKEYKKSTDKPPVSVKEGKLWLKEIAGSSPVKDNIAECIALQKDDCVLSMKDVWFCYEKKEPDVLRGVDLSIYPGCFTALLGANGTGKSTLLSVAAKALKPYRGRVKSKGKIVMLAQDPKAVFSGTTVLEELYFATDRSLSEDERIRIAQAMAERFGLLDYKDMHPYDLSGGWMQILAIAMALLKHPDILLIDEPTKGLDPVFKSRLAAVLKELTAMGTTILAVSHDIEFCAEHADYAALLFDGKVVGFNDTRSFFSGNRFYTTAANRIAEGVFDRALTCGEVADCLKDL